MTAVLTRGTGPDVAAPPEAPLDLHPAVSPPPDIVDQWGEHSFPASDPPANW